MIAFGRRTHGRLFPQILHCHPIFSTFDNYNILVFLLSFQRPLVRLYHLHKKIPLALRAILLLQLHYQLYLHKISHPNCL